MTETNVREVTASLWDYCRSERWAGYDPYDGLNSRWFRAFPFLQSRWPRLVMNQGLKRCPINLRWLCRVPREVNPKGLALFLASAARLAPAGLSNESEGRALADGLVKLRSPGWKRACWGYHFDWQTRTYLVPRFYPNIICTTFAAEALLDAHERWGDGTWLAAATDAGWFLLEELKRSEGPGGFCFSYTPLRPSRVHNASLLGGALLARLHARTGIREFREAALGAASYGIAHQQNDGSWIYGEDPNQEWIDSFHTGYNLLALDAVGRFLGHDASLESLRRGYDYYRRHFFAPEGVVKYFHDRTYPIDGHAVAHAVLTLVQLERLDGTSLDQAGQVIDWATRHLRHPRGYFYFQKWPWYTNRISYMRWTQAWMVRGLTEYLVHPRKAAPIPV